MTLTRSFVFWGQHTHTTPISLFFFYATLFPLPVFLLRRLPPLSPPATAMVDPAAAVADPVAVVADPAVVVADPTAALTDPAVTMLDSAR